MLISTPGFFFFFPPENSFSSAPTGLNWGGGVRSFCASREYLAVNGKGAGVKDTHLGNVPDGDGLSYVLNNELLHGLVFGCAMGPAGVAKRLPVARPSVAKLLFLLFLVILDGKTRESLTWIFETPFRSGSELCWSKRCEETQVQQSKQPGCLALSARLSESSLPRVFMNGEGATTSPQVTAWSGAKASIWEPGARP